MAAPPSHLKSWSIEDNGDVELNFMWVDTDIIDAIDGMMRNHITLEIDELPGRHLHIKEVRVFWDVEPWRVVETIGGKVNYINQVSYRNMDVICEETG